MIRKGWHHSMETRRKLSEAKKGEKNPQWGKPHSEEQRRRQSEALKGKPHFHGKKISDARTGKPHPHHGGKRPDLIKRNKELRGEKSSAWRGGASFEPYCPKFDNGFRDRVRAFWGYACGLCGKSQEDNGKKLHVHHVNYRKDACCNDEVARQFIPLCNSCHGKTTTGNHARWENRLGKLIEKRHGGRCYFHQKEQLAAWGAT